MMAETKRSDRSAYVRGVVALVLTATVGGCETAEPTHSAALRASLTPGDAKLSTADYWWDQPPTVRPVTSPDFQKLWDACQAECYARLFQVDREEYRLGLLTTVPTVSKQIFEPWRTDAVTVHDELESTLATIRRTLRFQIDRRPDGTYAMTPRVLVERFTSTERRLTNLSQYHQAFSGARAFADSPDQSGDLQLENGPVESWYALHRDPTLEADLAASIADRLRAG